MSRKIGKRIVYAVRHGSSLSITEGEIVDIKLNNKAYKIKRAEHLDRDLLENGFDQEKYNRMLECLSLCYTLRVKRINKPGGFSSWESPNKIVSLTEVERVTVIS